MTKALLYADSSLNIIDGSSVWLSTIAQVLAEIVDEVHVLAKTHTTNQHLIEPLRTHPRITIHEPPLDQASDSGMHPLAAAERLETLARLHQPQIILVRGFEACAAASKKKPVAVRLFSYITDLQFPLHKTTSKGVKRLRDIAAASKRMFAQTESARSYLEAVAPEAAGKTLLLPPVVPDSFFSGDLAVHPQGSSRGPLRLVYAGKFALDWRTREMLQLPGKLKERGIDAHLTMIGSKFQKDRKDPTWHHRMEEELRAADADPFTSVSWAGPMPREAVVELLRGSDLGLGWRSTSLDSSLELSSKVLEYGAAGVPPIINRTVDHEALFGDDYAFLLGDDSVDAVSYMIEQALPTYSHARATARKVAEQHSFASLAGRLRTALEEMNLLDAPRYAGRALKLTVATHDDKFLGDLLDLFATMPDVNAHMHRWQTLHTHDAVESEAAATWSDTILCEWAGPNAVWFSNNKPENTRLIVRLHAFELRGPWLDSICVDAVDDWVFVSEPYRDLAISRLGIAPGRCHVIPNALDTRDLDRPKTPDSRFHLGMVGYVTYNKRPDRALDLLETLLAHDTRYLLHFKGRPPWEYDYLWRSQSQRLAYEDFFARISESPLLKSHVVFEPFSPDIASWLRNIGFVLSPSATESFHLAPAEGMASGAVPVIWERHGARDIFGHDVVVSGSDEAAEAILALRDPDAFQESSRVAQVFAKRWARPEAHGEWVNLLRRSGRYQS